MTSWWAYTGGTVAAGGSGILNVWVSSNADPGTPDNLDLFSAYFLITPIGGAVPDGLQFNDPQGDTQLGDSGYIFNLDSANEVFGAGTVVSTNSNTNDFYEGGDGTLSGNGVDLDNGSGTLLLFRLDLDATLANAGDQFEIKMLDDGFTQFYAAGGIAPLTLHADSYNSFTVTAVPEPGTFCVLSILTAGATYRRMRRRSRA